MHNATQMPCLLLPQSGTIGNPSLPAIPTQKKKKEYGSHSRLARLHIRSRVISFDRVNVPLHARVEIVRRLAIVRPAVHDILTAAAVRVAVVPSVQGPFVLCVDRGQGRGESPGTPGRAGRRLRLLFGVSGGWVLGLALLLLGGGFFAPVAGERVAADGTGGFGVGAAGDDVDDGALDIALWVEELGFVLVEVLARVGGFVFEAFHELVEAGGQESA